MANIALGLELDLHRREPLLLRWYRAHSSTLRGLLSLLIVGLVWEIAGRSGRWPLILAPISDIWVKFVQLAATGGVEQQRCGVVHGRIPLSRSAASTRANTSSSLPCASMTA